MPLVGVLYLLVESLVKFLRKGISPGPAKVCTAAQRPILASAAARPELVRAAQVVAAGNIGKGCLGQHCQFAG